MQKRHELRELNDNPGIVFIIIFLTVIASISILIWAKFYANSPVPNKEATTLVFDARNIPTLQLGHYALWSIDEDGAYKFLKRFNSVNDELVSLDGSKLEELIIADINFPKEFMVTIEEEGDRDEEPGLTFVKSLLKENAADLRFEVTKPEIQSSFILASPTDGNSTINEQSGLWFTNNQKTGSLNLPKLPEGFLFEARVVHKKSDTEMRIGSFEQIDEEDDLSIFSLTEKGFNYPGEDFLTNLPENLEAPLNLANGDFQVIISIEPNIDGIDLTGEQIFCELFRADIPEGLEPYTSHPLQYSFIPTEINIKIND